MPFRLGSYPLFRLFGIQIYLHWSWAAVAVFEIWRNNANGMQAGHTHQPLWFYIAQYLCLFLIVLFHECGHALACKSVGGIADRIVLWPLGGVAYVQPPQRPGALLWSIAAGPLVNVALLPITIAPLYLMRGMGNTTAFEFLVELAFINVVLLVFNLLPIYPLDGGQILRALAWFVIGRARSLLFAAIVGLIGAIVLAALAIFANSVWLGVIVLYMGMRSFSAVKVARAQLKLEKTPRHVEARCPACRENPPVGMFWKCGCGNRLDTFAEGGACPACHTPFATTACPFCGAVSPRPRWYSTGGFVVTTPHQPAPVAG